MIEELPKYNIENILKKIIIFSLWNLNLKMQILLRFQNDF